MLCSKLFQRIDGLLIAARTVEQRGEFLDPAVLEKPDGVGTHGLRLVKGLGGPDPLLTEPELPMLERIGGQVELARRSLLQSVEVEAGGRRCKRWQGPR